LRLQQLCDGSLCRTGKLEANAGQLDTIIVVVGLPVGWSLSVRACARRREGSILARLNPEKQRRRRLGTQVWPEENPSCQIPGGGADRNAKKEFWPAIVAALCLGLFVLKAVTSLMQESSTWDETRYFGLGKYLLIEHRWDVPGSILHPPLSYYVHSIPLLFFPTDQLLWKSDAARAKDPQYLAWADLERGRAMLASSANQGDCMLDLSRLTMVLIGVLLGCFVYSWSYSLYGKWSALCAVILYSFSPDILAHTRLITPDICLTTFCFLTLYYFWRAMRDERLRDTVLAGVCLGLALLSQFTGLLLLPICFALMILWVGKKKAINLRNCCVFMIVGVTLLFLGYGMNLEPYFAGILYQSQYARIGHPVFLMGHLGPARKIGHR
jgi:hypothetical protein